MFEVARVKCIENIVEKRKNCSLGAISPLLHNILLPAVIFPCYIGTRFLLRDKRLFEISEVEITRVDCIFVSLSVSFVLELSEQCQTEFLF